MPARRATAVGPDGSPLPTEGGKEKLTFGCAFPGCGQNYSRMEYLKRHQRKHQDERPFQCKDCSKAFARSDVLLRHRRRCHPTPPPRDRSSHSPMPPLRAHPSVPISSSRTSEREASPIRGGRKHPRNSEGSHDDPATSRTRLSPDEEDDEDRYGSRFSRNGMGNGGVFGVTGQYYSGAPVSTESSYGTANLLPMFQNSSFHNMHDPNHLEDASVLLSMAYPGGVPGSTATPGEERSDWDQTGILSTEDSGPVAAAAAASASTSSSHNDKDTPSRESNFSSGAVDTPARPAAPGAVLPESINMAESMKWLASDPATTTTTTPSIWPSSEPLSPFNLSSLFATSPFGLSNIPSPGGVAGGVGVSLTNETTAMAIAAAAAAAAAVSQTDDQSAGISSSHSNNSNTGSSSPNIITLNNPPPHGTVNTAAATHPNPFVAALLNQLAMNDVPETLANPNPERPLLRLASKDIQIRAGHECPRGTRFYLPADRFAGCYQIPHWALPPLRSLSVMAARTYYSVLNHFSFVHDPTFQLIDTAACLAFAICTVGGIRIGSNIRRGEGKIVPVAPRLSPNGAWEEVFTNFTIPADPEEAEDQRRIEEWDGGQIVRHEKTNMLVKSFSLAQGVLMTEYNVALLQALLLYHAPYFLSKNESERRHGNMFLGTIITITRQIGFFQPGLEHANVAFSLPTAPYTQEELNKSWRRWVQLESRRRTAFLVYQLDTMSSIETQFAPILSSIEVAALPLPAPDSIWKARTAKEWLQAMQLYRPITLDSAMRRLFNLPTTGRFDEAAGADPTRNILSTAPYGPFARTVLITTLLRGIMEVGEGKRCRGDWRDLTDLWVSAEHLRPGAKCLTAEGVDLGACTPEALRTRYSFALQRWRDGWESDPSCKFPPGTPSPAPFTPMSSASPGSSTSGASESSGQPVYCEDALPFFFLSTALLKTLLNSPSTTAGRNVLAGERYGDLLDASRTLARASTSAPSFFSIF